MRPPAARVWLPLDRLTFDRRLQLRGGGLYDEAHVERLCDAHEAGRAFDPLEAVEERKGKRLTYWVFSGFNRGETYRRRSVGSVEVLVTPGTFRDAEYLALGANAWHGLNRTPEDCRRAFDRLVDSPALLDRALAESRGNGGVERAIAAACGIGHSVVGKYLALRGLRACRETGRVVPARPRDPDPEPTPPRAEPRPPAPDRATDHGDTLEAVQRDVRSLARRLAELPATPSVESARLHLDRLRNAAEDAAAELFEASAASSG